MRHRLTATEIEAKLAEKHALIRASRERVSLGGLVTFCACGADCDQTFPGFDECYGQVEVVDEEPDSGEWVHYCELHTAPLTTMLDRMLKDADDNHD